MLHQNLLFLSTEVNNLESALIRRFTMCAWSHTGFYRCSDHYTFSAMSDGRGVAWRPPNLHTKMLLLDHPQVEAMLARALTQEGRPYNVKEILSFAFDDNSTTPDSWDCCQLVLWSAVQAGCPLVNHTFIPIQHMSPRDILLSRDVEEIQL